MAKNLYVLNLTDAWNSNPELLGVFTSKKLAIRAANKHSGYKLNSEYVEQLETINQTQGRDENYGIEQIQQNTLI